MKINYPDVAESILRNNINMKVPVTGDSMSPLLRTGDSIYVEPVKAKDLSAGDILVYKTEGNMVAHRLIRILRSNGKFMFLTKGDTFSSADSLLKESDLIGRVYATGKHGADLNFKKGIFSLVNRLSYLLSPLSSFLYNLRRKYKGFDAVCGTGTRSNEEMFITALLKHEFSDEKLNSDTAVMLKDIVDFAKVYNLAYENGISQILYTILKKMQDDNIIELRKDSEKDFFNKLRHDYLYTAAKNTLLYSEFNRVVASLRNEKIDVMAMKGAVLAELVYKDIGTRSMSDVDLLIRKEDIAKADAVLNTIGYQAVDPSPFDTMETPNNYLTTRDYRSRKSGNPSFHLHWHMVNSSIPAPYSSNIDMKAIWEDAVSVEIAGTAVGSMSPHHFLIHLSEHAMRVKHSASKLIYLIDVAILIKRYGNGLDWHKTVQAGKAYGLDIFVHNILGLTQLNTGIDIPEWVFNSLKPDKSTLGERLFFNISAKGHGISGLSYLVHLGMNRGIIKKTSFVSRTLFPPAWVLAKRHPGSCGKAPLKFYLYRLKEILSGILMLPVHRFRNICLLLSVCMFFSLVSSNYAAGPAEDATAIEKNSSYTMESGIPEYLIAPNDVLEIKVWRGFEEKKYEVAVKPDGYIMVAFVTIKVSDMTVRQAEAELNRALLEYIREPRVEILIKEYLGRTVTLLGAVQSLGRLSTGPGIYVLKGKTTLSQLVITAGGFAKDAELERVRIAKPEGTAKEINLFEIMFGGEMSKDVIVDRGDIIYIPYKTDTEERNVYVLGEARSPGIYKMTSRLTLLQVLGKAGGYKEEALIDEIRIIRGGLDNPQFIVADTKAVLEGGDITKDLYLQNNDIIYIPKTKIANWNAFLAKLRPTLEFLIMPFAGVSVIDNVITGK
jgi:protein involved in polysaccharide export with SLBB domain